MWTQTKSTEASGGEDIGSSFVKRRTSGVGRGTSIVERRGSGISSGADATPY
ncbi:hypothetical protein STRTUCAR8_05838 [Streptomyces turgidiscabies Car8]|uniref:Uncharacterized protein n=1 Tax=Streptomyces turgidiscabies (strain Car8) TaxID=698760 RepID=L7FHR7_STRT8|nr:hypothetical protein STRTUCAR8_05838 [Streptomyces turgidiscabies Car8]